MLRRFFYNNFPLTKVFIGIARILYFIVTIFTGKKPRIIVRNNISYEVDLAEGTNLSLFLFGSFQKHVIKSKLIKIPADGVVFDVGANFGLMALPFAQMVTQGKVYAFEPTHYAIEKLTRNILLNPRLSGRIEVVNVFVSEKTTQQTSMKAIASWKVNSEKEPDRHPLNMGSEKPTEGVGAIALDDFYKAQNITRVDFIKIDTEGYESDVLKGASELIAKFRPQVIFELGQYSMIESGIDFSFYTTYFHNLNYRMYDSVSRALITMENYKKYVPARSSIDIIAIPSN